MVRIFTLSKYRLLSAIIDDSVIKIDGSPVNNNFLVKINILKKTWISAP